MRDVYIIADSGLKGPSFEQAAEYWSTQSPFNETDPLLLRALRLVHLFMELEGERLHGWAITIRVTSDGPISERPTYKPCDTGYSLEGPGYVAGILPEHELNLAQLEGTEAMDDFRKAGTGGELPLVAIVAGQKRMVFRETLINKLAGQA